jgi:hypothetical protein
MSAAAPDRTPLRLRFFFVVMASAVIVTVFAGFAPTFYLRGSFAQTRPMSVLLHVHGVVFSAWVSFFLVQTLLIERGSRRLHQRLGWIGAGIAAAMVTLVAAAVVEELRRVNGFPPPPLALALSAFDIIVFAVLVGAALYFRKRSDCTNASCCQQPSSCWALPCFASSSTSLAGAIWPGSRLFRRCWWTHFFCHASPTTC